MTRAVKPRSELNTEVSEPIDIALIWRDSMRRGATPRNSQYRLVSLECWPEKPSFSMGVWRLQDSAGSKMTARRANSASESESFPEIRLKSA
jgi:hypothetical protein